MKKRIILILFQILLILLTFNPTKALEVIRDTELENFTHDIINLLVKNANLETQDLNIYFIKSNEVNAFVTGGTNIFINTELIIKSEDYREYAAVIAHELAHILGGHVFSTSIEISNLSDRAMPVYLLGILGIISGSTETGIAGVMVGQASVSDGFTYYSRTQEASADQAAIKILCENGIDGKYLISFLQKLENMQTNKNNKNYRTTHPKAENRIAWIASSLSNIQDCEYEKNLKLEKRFKLLRGKLHGFTHTHSETEAVFNTQDDTDLYATAVSNYFKGEHNKSINNLEILISRDPSNPFYKELLGEIYFVNHDFEKAAKYQTQANKEISEINDLYFMMLGNYLLSLDIKEKNKISITYLKKSIQLNPKNAYSWFLLARAYANNDQFALANYATAERYFLIGERSLSYEFAKKAMKNIEENSPEWYRTSDLLKIYEKEVTINKN